MKTLKALALVTFLVLPFATAAGCKGNKAADELNKLADKMCACKDKACADGVQKEIDAWGKKHADTRATKSAMEKAKNAATKAMECYMKVAMPKAP